MTAGPPAMPVDLDALRVARDTETARQERGVPCTCLTRGHVNGRMVAIDVAGCWLHDLGARVEHLRLLICEECEADELAESVDVGGLCRVCAATCCRCHKVVAARVLDDEPLCGPCLADLPRACECCSHVRALDAGGWCSVCCAEAGDPRGPFRPSLVEF